MCIYVCVSVPISGPILPSPDFYRREGVGICSFFSSVSLRRWGAGRGGQGWWWWSYKVPCRPDCFWKARPLCAMRHTQSDPRRLCLLLPLVLDGHSTTHTPPCTHTLRRSPTQHVDVSDALRRNNFIRKGKPVQQWLSYLKTKFIAP